MKRGKRGTSEWSVGKLMSVILLVVFLALVIFGVVTKGFNPLYEKAEGLYNSVLAFFGWGEEVPEKFYTKPLEIQGVDKGTLEIRKKFCKWTPNDVKKGIYSVEPELSSSNGLLNIKKKPVLKLYTKSDWLNIDDGVRSDIEIFIYNIRKALLNLKWGLENKGFDIHENFPDNLKKEISKSCAFDSINIEYDGKYEFKEGLSILCKDKDLKYLFRRKDNEDYSIKYSWMGGGYKDIGAKDKLGENVKKGFESLIQKKEFTILSQESVYKKIYNIEISYDRDCFEKPYRFVLAKTNKHQLVAIYIKDMFIGIDGASRLYYKGKEDSEWKLAENDKDFKKLSAFFQSGMEDSWKRRLKFRKIKDVLIDECGY
jgi:hypothetical protein